MHAHMKSNSYISAERSTGRQVDRQIKPAGKKMYTNQKKKCPMVLLLRALLRRNLARALSW